MKRLSWPGAIVVAGSTLLSWLAGSPVISPSNRTSPPRIESAAPPAPLGPARSAGSASHDAEAASIASIASMQLHDWRARLSAHATRERNVFSFRRSAKPVPAAAPARGFLEAASNAGQPALVLFKLIGVAEDPGAEGPTRTAIISGQGQLYLAKQGDTVAFIYRVGQMSADSVELIDTTGGASLQLTLK